MATTEQKLQGQTPAFDFVADDSVDVSKKARKYRDKAPEPTSRLIRSNQVGNPGDANFKPARVILRNEVELRGPNATMPVQDADGEYYFFAEQGNFGHAVPVIDAETGEPVKVVTPDGVSMFSLLYRLQATNPGAKSKNDKK